MKKRFRLIHRGERGGLFYCVDSETGKRWSLKTRDRDAAEQIVLARNQSLRQPSLNLQIAKAYLAGTDNGVNTRTWRHAIEAVTNTKLGANKERWLRVVKDTALAPMLPFVIIETKAESLLTAMKAGTVSTNIYLRRIHNFALDMSWLPWPVLPKKRWPRIQFKKKRAIRWEEHQRIIAAEVNAERKAFYQLAWQTGASQSDLALLNAEDINWQDRLIAFSRKKTGTSVKQFFDEETATLLLALPSQGPLFPYLRRVRAGDRATEFKQRCDGLKIKGVSLHCYRYAWAERALKCGYPERFAQQALGHNSKAVHHVYARNAEVTVPSLDDWEESFRTGSFQTGTNGMQQQKLVAVDFQAPESTAGGEPAALPGATVVG